MGFIEKPIINIPDGAPDDVRAFLEAVSRGVAMFLERREQYGSFLNHNTLYIEAGLNIKADRMIRDMERRQPVKDDTLLDMGVYSFMGLAANKG